MTIPKVIHQIWVGGPMPERFEAFAETWRSLHPTWAYRLWTEADAKGLVNQSLWDEAPELAPNHVGQLRADALRYEVLLEHGGLYVDADMECLRPIDKLCRDVECWLAWEMPQRWANNAVMAAAPNHELLGRLVAGLERNVRRFPGRKPNLLSGPQYLTPILRQCTGVAVYPKHFFYPYSYRELHRSGERFPKSYAVHHWNNRRRERGVPL